MLIMLYWTPRILGVLLALLAGLFSLDVFGQQTSFWRTFAALLIHLLPALALTGLLVISWKWSWIGGIGYTALGVLYLFLQNDNNYPVIYLPLFISGALFCLDWFLRKHIKIAREEYNGNA